MDKLEALNELLGESTALYPTDLLDAVIGVVEYFGKEPVVLVDRDKALEIFQNRDGMTYEEAVEHFEYNVAGSFMGEQTPAYATLIKD